MRKLPIFTFCNKMDRPSLSPFELIDQVMYIICLFYPDCFHIIMLMMLFIELTIRRNNIANSLFEYDVHFKSIF